MTLEELESRLGRLRIAEAPESFAPRAVAHAAAMGRLQRQVRRSFFALAASLVLAIGGSFLASSPDARRRCAPPAASEAVARQQDPIDKAIQERDRLAHLIPLSSEMLEREMCARTEFE